MTSNAGGSSEGDRLRGLRFADFAIVSAPFLFYWLFVSGALHPVAYPDSFAYLWDGPVDAAYFTGRSLTTRLVYSACGLDPERIAAAQLAIAAASAFGIQALLREPRRPYRNAFVAVLVAATFSSYTFTATSVMLTAEPIFLSLLLLFPCALFLARGRAAPWIVLGVGVAFVLSKNVAPYACAILLAARLVTLRPRVDRRLAAVLGALAVVAAASAWITSRYDTSVHVNAFHNVTRRVLDTPGRPALFHARYGMPLSPQVLAFTGQSAGGARVMDIDPATRNFVLRDEGSGLTAWVRDRGLASYVDFLLVARPGDAIRGVRNAWRKRAPGAVDYMTAYLGHRWRHNHPNNLDSLAATGRANGLLGRDPLALVFGLLARAGFGDVRLVLAFGLAGLVLARGVRRPEYFALAGAGLVTAVGLYAISFYGDAMEVQRHTAPAVVLATTAGALLAVAGVRFASEVVARWLERAHVWEGWARLPVPHPIATLRARRARGHP